VTGRSGILLVNPVAGSTKETPEVLSEMLPSLELRPCEPADLRRQLDDAVAAGVEVVAVGGGDGSQRTAAAVLAHSASTLLPVPLGTFNHFARAIGIDTVEAAAEALERGTPTRIDICQVNDEVFLNNASIGWYAEMLRTRMRLAHRMPRQVAKVAALLAHLPKAPRVDVNVAGKTYRSWLVWVGNGRYDLRVGHLAERLSLTDHHLDVRILIADRRLARFRAAFALLTGRVETSDALERFTTTEATFRVGRRAVAVGVDGEGISVVPPLCFRSAPEALSVLPSPSWTDGTVASSSR
jgi:diacylglycerol kinase family enzyme